MLFIIMVFLFFFFFFQAEDGIRDATVTGVQTCALPIYGGAEAAHRIAARDQEARDRAGQEPDDQEPDQDEHATHPSPATSAEQRYPDRATVKRGQDAG